MSFIRGSNFISSRRNPYEWAKKWRKNRYLPILSAVSPVTRLCPTAAIPAMIVNACKRGTVSLPFRKHLHPLFTTQISHERWYNLKQLEWCEYEMAWIAWIFWCFLTDGLFILLKPEWTRLNSASRSDAPEVLFLFYSCELPSFEFQIY